MHTLATGGPLRSFRAGRGLGLGCIRRFWITGRNIGRDVILRIYFMPFASRARVEVTGSEQSTSLYYTLDWHDYPGQELRG